MVEVFIEDIFSWDSKFETCFYSNRLLDKLNSRNTAVSNPVDIQGVKKAIYYAKKYHGAQKRQSGEPYYSHPLEVAYMLAEHSTNGGSKYFRTDLLVTAVLHDTIEDTELTFEMIKIIFGEIEASQVMDLTRIKEDRSKISSAEMIKDLWLQKKYDLLFIKQLDRLHNLQTIGAKSTDRMHKIVTETFDTFLVFTMGAQDSSLEKALYKLCCETLSIEKIQHEFPQITQDHSHLISAKDTDIHQHLSQVFRNVTNPTKN